MIEEWNLGELFFDGGGHGWERHAAFHLGPRRTHALDHILGGLLNDSHGNARAFCEMGELIERHLREYRAEPSGSPVWLCLRYALVQT